ncbi:MAG TPA: exosortase H-associated membrane protein [Thermoanaerobaculia bacterium]|nr:exosortase H-associated membrane protein [Thermoanaerobaculia bacterium]
MPRIDWRTALKAVIGFAVGLAAWTMLSTTYDSMLASVTEATIRLFERPQVTRLNPDGEYISIDRQDFDPRSKHPEIPASDLTFNLILLTALFAAEKRTFSDRNMIRFALALLVLSLTHVFGVVTEVMSIYVARLGPWSEANYGPIARNFWGVANHFYRLVLMYAIAFGLWWGFRPKGDAESEKTKPRKKRKPT